MGKLIDLTGQRFGRWIVIGKAKNIGKRTAWLCKCECGETRPVKTDLLRRGESKSCGCIRKEKLIAYSTTHGGSKTHLYAIWNSMCGRCHVESSSAYPRYGGRGVSVCDEWRCNFQAFMEWAILHGYEDKLTLDRIDNAGGYSPDNCRWVDMRCQCNNKTNNARLTFHGETHTVTEWSRITGISRSTINDRRNLGWSVEDTLTVPPRLGNRIKKPK